MKDKIKWTSVIFIIVVTAFVIGTFNPQKAAIAIILGSSFMALSTYFT